VVYAAFDPRLRARVEELAREEEDLLRDIAALKKSVPGNAATAYSEAFRDSLKKDEEALEAAKEEESAAAGGGAETSREKENRGAGTLNLDKLERQDDVQRAYSRAVEGLAKLKREMPAVVARMERARNAGSYVVTEK
jgi:kinetochor protein Mis14/NSL1